VYLTAGRGEQWVGSAGADGTVRWARPIPGARSLLPPVLHTDRRLFVVEPAKGIHVVDPVTGRALGFWPLPELPVEGFAIAHDGSMFVAGGRSVARIHPATGKTLWRTHVGNAASHVCVGPGDAVFAYGIEGEPWPEQWDRTHVYALARTDGRRLWSTRRSGAALGLAIGPSERVYLGLTEVTDDRPLKREFWFAHLDALDGRTGTLIRRVTAKYTAMSGAPLVAPGGDVLTVLHHGALQLWSPDLAQLRWERTVLFGARTPVIAGDGMVYVAAYPGRVFAFGLDGTESGALDLPGSVSTDLALEPRGQLYVATSNADRHALHALATGSPGLARTGWPCRFGTAANTGSPPSP
jgi:outer membrane protein assembly factor BamB